MHFHGSKNSILKIVVDTLLDVQIVPRTIWTKLAIPLESLSSG